MPSVCFKLKRYLIFQKNALMNLLYMYVYHYQSLRRYEYDTQPISCHFAIKLVIINIIYKNAGVMLMYLNTQDT